MSRPFDAKAMPKCIDRLSKTKRALQQCRSATNFIQFASAWSDLLIHSGSVLNALDAGSKSTPQGRQWYGGVKRQGRADPLVSYMLQARNAEEHAVSKTMENAPSSLAIGKKESVHISNLTVDEAFLENPEREIVGKAWRTNDGKPPTIERTAGGPKLVTVRDERFKNSYPPPTEHNGKPLAKDDPITIGEIYIEYLESLVAKAGELS